MRRWRLPGRVPHAAPAAPAQPQRRGTEQHQGQAPRRGDGVRVRVRRAAIGDIEGLPGREVFLPIFEDEQERDRGIEDRVEILLNPPGAKAEVDLGPVVRRVGNGSGRGLREDVAAEIVWRHDVGRLPYPGRKSIG